MAEDEVLGIELRRRADGAPWRDMSECSEWRQDASRENLDLVSFYGRYLVGQFSGMSSALSLEAVRAAFDLDGVPREDWPEMTRRLVLLHSWVVEEMKARKGGDGNR
jgi:hypothetical protein